MDYLYTIQVLLYFSNLKLNKVFTMLGRNELIFFESPVIFCIAILIFLLILAVKSC